MVHDAMSVAVQEIIVFCPNLTTGGATVRDTVPPTGGVTETLTDDESFGRPTFWQRMVKTVSAATIMPESLPPVLAFIPLQTPTGLLEAVHESGLPKVVQESCVVPPVVTV
jgi:hypothetical protein